MLGFGTSDDGKTYSSIVLGLTPRLCTSNTVSASECECVCVHVYIRIYECNVFFSKRTELVGESRTDM